MTYEEYTEHSGQAYKEAMSDSLRRREIQDRIEVRKSLLRFYTGLQNVLHGAECPVEGAGIEMDSERIHAAVIWRRIDKALTDMRRLIEKNQEEDKRRLGL